MSAAEDLAVDFSPRPELERVLRRCTELLGCDAGSICSVDEAAGTYRKEADIGVACQSGQVFPLTEGMTGTVLRCTRVHRGGMRGRRPLFGTTVNSHAPYRFFGAVDGRPQERADQIHKGFWALTSRLVTPPCTGSHRLVCDQSRDQPQDQLVGSI